MKTHILNFFRKIFLIYSLERILVNLTKGKEFGRLITKLPPNHYQYRKNSIRKVNRNGINYFLDISDMVNWHIYFGFKEKSRHKLYSLLSNGITFIDIGANVGEVALNAAKIIGRKGRAYAFEPDPMNFKRLKKNHELNNFNNIVLVNEGLADEPGELFLQVFDERNVGMNRVIEKSKMVNNDRIYRKIRVNTLDEFVKTNPIENVALIKIDVEGYEMKILKGAEKTISLFNPILFIELDDDNLKDQGSSALELVGHLLSQGYTIRHAKSDEMVDDSYDFMNCHFDMVCVPNY